MNKAKLWLVGIIVVSVMVLVFMVFGGSKSPDNIKLGMTYEEVIKVAGEPDYDGYKKSNHVEYNDKSVWFKDGKVTSGQTVGIMEEAKKNGDKEKQAAQDMKYKASFFGRKPVAEIQEKVNVYPATRFNDGMMYMWANDGNKLVRVDTNDGYTTVHKYDEDTDDGLGQVLYTGKTILQKQDKKVVYQ